MYIYYFGYQNCSAQNLKNIIYNSCLLIHFERKKEKRNYSRYNILCYILSFSYQIFRILYL